MPRLNAGQKARHLHGSNDGTSVEDRCADIPLSIHIKDSGLQSKRAKMDTNHSDVSNPSCGYDFPTGITLSIANLITTVLGTLSNVLILLSSSRLNSVSNLFIVNLCVADLMVSAVALPLNLVWTMRKTQGVCLSRAVLYSRRVFVSLTSCSSLLILCWVSIERLFVMSWPFRYKFYITRARIRIVLGISWSVSLMYGVTAAFDASAVFTTLFATASTIACNVVIILCYVKIFFIVWRQKKIQPELHISQHQSHAMEKQVAKTMGLVVGVFTLCFAPLTVTRQTLSRTTHGALHDGLLLLALSHSAMNPVIYFYRFKDYRAVLKRLLYCKPSPRRISTTVANPCLDQELTEFN